MLTQGTGTGEMAQAVPGATSAAAAAGGGARDRAPRVRDRDSRSDRRDR